MLDFLLVLGQVPGTNIQITFTEIMLGLLIVGLLFVILKKIRKLRIALNRQLLLGWRFLKKMLARGKVLDTLAFTVIRRIKAVLGIVAYSLVKSARKYSTRVASVKHLLPKAKTAQ